MTLSSMQVTGYVICQHEYLRTDCYLVHPSSLPHSFHLQIAVLKGKVISVGELAVSVVNELVHAMQKCCDDYD
jgi:hypothetical protein